MHIKPRACLKARDLPLAESPFLAARLVKQALLGQCEPLPRFDPYDIPGFSAGARPEFLRARLLALLESGDLVLVHNPLTSGQPIDPHVVWKPDSSSSATSGKWIVSSAFPFLSMSSEVNALNREELTPAALGLVKAGGSANHQSLIGEKSSDSSKSEGPKDHKLSLPLGAAAGIAPLAGASERTLEQTDSVRLPLHVTVGVFLDGTLNNVENIRVFKRRVERECLIPMRQDRAQLEQCQNRLALLLGESYANAPTNVVKLYSLYEEGEKSTEAAKGIFVKVYEPGAGTRSGGEDSVWGMATGLGETGVEAQARRAFDQVAIRIRGETDFPNVERVIVDLFGFSRGAAASRYAANEILRGTEGLLGEAFRQHKIPWPDDVSIRFVGLFDTVAGIVNPSMLDFSAGNNRNKPLNIALDPKRVRAAVQIAASDETRANFALNSLSDSGKSLPANFREIMLPGAHSDVGGGYPDTQKEDLLLYPALTITGSDCRWPQKTMEWDNLRAIEEFEKAEGWIGEYSLPLSDGQAPKIVINNSYDPHPLPDGRVDLKLTMERMVLGGLSTISLNVLYQLAKKEGVPFTSIPDKADFGIPSALSEIYESLSRHILSGQDHPSLESDQLSFLKQRYIHHSHHFNLFKFIAWNEVAELEPPFREMYASKPASSNRRVIYPNDFKE